MLHVAKKRGNHNQRDHLVQSLLGKKRGTATSPSDRPRARAMAARAVSLRGLAGAHERERNADSHAFLISRSESFSGPAPTSRHCKTPMFSTPCRLGCPHSRKRRVLSFPSATHHQDDPGYPRWIKQEAGCLLSQKGMWATVQARRRSAHTPQDNECCAHMPSQAQRSRNPNA